MLRIRPRMKNEFYSNTQMYAIPFLDVTGSILRQPKMTIYKKLLNPLRGGGLNFNPQPVSEIRTRNFSLHFSCYH